MSALAAGTIDRVRTFFETDIWRPALADLPWYRALGYRAIRVATATVRGAYDNMLLLRAAALTYYGVLSVVPFLAFAFAVLKGLGAYRTFIDATARPYLGAVFGPNTALYGAIERILQFVDATNVSKLGTLAVVFLLYTSVTLISSVEQALNAIFGAKSGRSFVRQLTDYTTLLVITPILLVVATTLSTAAQSSAFVAFVRDTLGLGFAIDVVVSVTPLVMVALALFAVYLILPNVRVRVSSALIGASVAAVVWQGAIVLHVRSQVGVARYNALYSSLGAIPIFLVWTYVSWTIVLVGAQLAASHQDERIARGGLGAGHADPALREMIAVALGAIVTRDFLAGSSPRPAAALAEVLEAPLPVVQQDLDALVRAGLFLRALSGADVGYVPGGDADRIRAHDLRQAVRRDARADEAREAVAERLGAGLSRVLREVDAGSAAQEADPTLRELAELGGATLAAATRESPRPRGGDGRGRPEPLEEERPGLPH